MKATMAPGPIPVVKSRRMDRWRGLTSCDPGLIVPVAFFPLLREDQPNGRIAIQVKSDETVKVVLNPVKVKAAAYLVPKSALSRFGGSMDVVNRSYEDEAAPAGFGTTPKWVEQLTIGSVSSGIELLDTLGIHYNGSTVPMNSDLVESYNVLVNHMRKSVLTDLPQRDKVDTTLAEAFWDHTRFAHVQPSFDADAMEGTVPVGLDGTAPVFGIGNNSTAATGTITESATGATLPSAQFRGAFVRVQNDAGNIPVPFVAADLSGANGASISLANIEAAKQTQVFAAMRDRYKNVPDEYLVDLLMSGIRIPDDALRHPILLGTAETVLGQQERYATDGASLDQSVSNMASVLTLQMAAPPVNPGGFVLVVMQIVPEQLHERMFDPALTYEGSGLKAEQIVPDYLSDYLDPQKVAVVPNNYVDVFHSVPDGVFGYAPLNYGWQRDYSRVGGRFKRPRPDAFVEDRQRIWSVEPTDPVLGTSFYLCPKPFPKTVFAVTTVQPYEVFTVADVAITGNTVFGAVFDENQESYAEVLAKVDTDRIESVDPVATQQPAKGADDEKTD